MTPTTKRGLPRKRVAAGAPLADRILLHTDRSGECWLWTGTKNADGYGRIRIDGRTDYSHRISYVAFVGPIPEGMHLDHLCRNPPCANPGHLEAVTPLENTRRGMAHGVRATACPNGHAYDEANTYRDPKGLRRYCRTCQQVRRELAKAIPYEEAMRRKRLGIPIVDLAAHFAAERHQEIAA